MVDVHPTEKVYTISEYPANDLWHIQTITDRSAMLKLESLGLELSLDELYGVLDKLPAE